MLHSWLFRFDVKIIDILRVLEFVVVMVAMAVVTYETYVCSVLVFDSWIMFLLLNCT